VLFQILDNKTECSAIYHKGHFIDDVQLHSLTRTWDYTDSLDSLDIEYAKLFCGGKSLGEACPQYLKSYWEAITAKFKAYVCSFNEAKIDLNDVCLYDLMPEGFLLEYCEIRNRVTDYVFQNFERPANYDFLLGLTKSVNKMQHANLNLDVGFLNKNIVNPKALRLRKRIQEIDLKVRYNIFGSKTGRLTTEKNSFPIHTLDKSLRSVIKPNNDWLVELDFNAAELRTFLAMADVDQPEGDIHEWIGKNIFNDVTDRDETKRKVFAWLYNPESQNKELNSIFNKEEMLKKFYINGTIETPYHRKIQADQHHALNYLIQSTASDLFLRRMVAIDELLEGRKSYVAYCIHDSLVLDFSSDDREILMEIVERFSKTEIGNFKVNLSAGKDFGNMRSLKV
jgi:hypothetical protein